MLAPVPHERDSQPPGPGAPPCLSADGGPEPQGPQAALPGDAVGAHREDQPAG